MTITLIRDIPYSAENSLLNSLTSTHLLSCSFTSILHCSKVFPPHNLVYLTELYTFSALFHNFRVAHPLVFCWMGLSKLQKKKGHPKDELTLFSLPVNETDAKYMSKLIQLPGSWLLQYDLTNPTSCPRKHNCLIPIWKQECTLDPLAVGKETPDWQYYSYSRAKQTYSP